MTNGQVRFESGANFTGANATVTSSVLGWAQTNTLSGRNITLTGSTFAIEGTNTLTIGATSTGEDRCSAPMRSGRRPLAAATLATVMRSARG